MNEVVKIEVIRMPKTFIVGKEMRYSHVALEKGDNRLPCFWDKCYKENTFAPLEAQSDYIYNHSHAGVFLDWHLDDNFTYIVGLLMFEGVTVPDEYVIRELPESDVALLWVKTTSLAETRVVPFETTSAAIHDLSRSFANMKWCADLFHHTRSVVPDENGEVILDCYIPLD
ncbi:MAG: GyrI-like domain-containing protein [Oscillospiraceae bacterium]|nr:GyrI-like domain-containing protein [Oscillospiraceae bacterium]